MFKLGARTHVDWWQVITDLERHDCSQLAISREMRRSIGWVDYVKNSPGADPKFRDACALLALWAHRTGCEIDAVPMLQHSGNSATAL